MHVRAPGKINVYLGVGPRHDDGYHALATVFQAVSLYEDVYAYVADGFSASNVVRPGRNALIENAGTAKSPPAGRGNDGVEPCVAIVDPLIASVEPGFAVAACEGASM